MSPFKKFLVPTDFSPCAERALAYAVQLAATGAEVVLQHVFAFPHDWYYWDVPGVESLRKVVEETARSRLKALVAGRESQGLTFTERLDVNSDVSRTILAAIEEEAPDVVVMGTMGWVEERPQLGSVAEQIARRAEMPVLMVPGGAAGFTDSPRILVPLFASHASATSLRFGERIAVALRGSLDILHVLPDAPFGPSFLGDEPIEAGDLLEPEHRLRRLGKFATKHLLSATAFSVHLDEGDFVDEVAEFVEDERVDLVVLARSDAGNRPHKAELIAHKVACPVLVVPAMLISRQQASAETGGPHRHSMQEVPQ